MPLALPQEDGRGWMAFPGAGLTVTDLVSALTVQLLAASSW